MPKSVKKDTKGWAPAGAPAPTQKSSKQNVKSGKQVADERVSGHAGGAAAKSQVQGEIIAVTSEGLLGWAMDPRDASRPISVTIVSGADVLGSATANLFENDQIQRQVGTGVPGFLVPSSGTFKGKAPLKLILRDEIGLAIGSPFVIHDAEAVKSLLTPLKPVAYEGHVDQLRDGRISGWAWKTDAPDDPVVVELYEDSDRLDRTEATIYRDDLFAAGKRGGHCGFHFELPISLLDDRIHSLKIKIARSNYQLPGASIAFGPIASGKLIEEVVSLRAEVTRLTQAIDKILSPQGEIQINLVRTLSARIAALAELQRETIESELDALRKIAFTKNINGELDINSTAAMIPSRDGLSDHRPAEKVTPESENGSTNRNP